MIQCDLLKNSISDYLRSEVEVMLTREACILSLPIKDLDGVNAEVFIEELGLESYLVHDGGKTIGHLETSGLLLSKSRLSLFSDLAKRLGVSFDGGVFQAFAKPNNLQSVALSIGQCCSISLFELLNHSPFSEEERIRAKVSTEIRNWSETSGIAVKKDVKIPGTVRQYTLDFVAQSDTPVAVSLLIPTYGSRVSAERYGLQVLDINQTSLKSYKRIAVLAKPEKWTRAARHIVAKLANETAEVSEFNTLLSTGISEALTKLSKAA